MEHAKQWRKSPGRHASGETLWVGKVAVGSWWYDATMPKGSDVPRYAGALDLPMLTKRTAYSTQDEAKAAIERRFEKWVAALSSQQSGADDA